MKLLKNKKFLIYSIIIAVVLFAISFYRAATTGITYDEAYTYLSYVDGFNLEKLKMMISPGVLANNHLLNTLLIVFVTKLTAINFNELIIRLPNLILYLVYFIVSYQLSKKYKNKYLVFSLFAFNYGLNEFSGLARGYGMASVLVLCALYFYKSWNESPTHFKNLLLTYLFMLLSTFANTVSLLIFATILIDSLFKLIRSRSLWELIKTTWWALLPLATSTLFMVYYHFIISGNNLPLYGGKHGFINDVIESAFQIYGIQNKIVMALLIILIIFFVIKTIKRKPKQNQWYLMIIYLFLLVLSTKLFHQPWITGRSLLPSISLFIYCFAELLNNRKYSGVATGITLLALMSMFTGIVSLKGERFWIADYQLRGLAYETMKEENCNSELNEKVEKALGNPALTFYQQKIKNEKNYNIYQCRFTCNHKLNSDE